MDDSELAQAVNLILLSRVFASLTPFGHSALSSCWTPESGQHMLYECNSPGHACYSGIANRSPKVCFSSFFTAFIGSERVSCVSSLDPLLRACLRRSVDSIQTWRTLRIASRLPPFYQRFVKRSRSSPRCRAVELSRPSGVRVTPNKVGIRIIVLFSCPVVSEHLPGNGWGTVGRQGMCSKPLWEFCVGVVPRLVLSTSFARCFGTHLVPCCLFIFFARCLAQWLLSRI